MIVDFDQMPDTARLWIYQSAQPLTEEVYEKIAEATRSFLSQWQAHGQQLKAAFCIQHHHFLILAVDEGHHAPSGCSIDASVHFIQSLEKQLGISLMTSGQVAFWIEDKIKLLPFHAIKQQVEDQVVTPKTMVFDHTIKNVGALRTHWSVPAAESWVKRYF